MLRAQLPVVPRQWGGDVGSSPAPPCPRGSRQMAETGKEMRDGAGDGSSCGENSSGVGSDGDEGAAPQPPPPVPNPQGPQGPPRLVGTVGTRSHVWPNVLSRGVRPPRAGTGTHRAGLVPSTLHPPRHDHRGNGWGHEWHWRHACHLPRGPDGAEARHRRVPTHQPPVLLCQGDSCGASFGVKSCRIWVSSVHSG